MLKNINKFKKIINEIKNIAEDVYLELGPGFEENDYQTAMHIEFSQSKKYEALREVSIELFYKDQYLKFGELDFLITPKKGSNLYPLPFLIETKVANLEPADSYDQIRRYLMSCPKNSSSMVNQVEIAVLIVFTKNSKLKKGEISERYSNQTVLTKEPSIPYMPDLNLYINSYYYDKELKTVKPIVGLFEWVI